MKERINKTMLNYIERASNFLGDVGFNDVKCLRAQWPSG